MSDNLNLTVSDVTNPNNNFGKNVLGEAMQKQADQAKAQLVDLAVTVLARARNVRAQHESAIASLEAQIAKEKKSLDSLRATMAESVVSGDKSILPLAAELGMKCEVVDFMRRNSIVVPPNDDPVWKAE